MDTELDIFDLKKRMMVRVEDQLKVVQTHKNRQISTRNIVLVVPLQATKGWQRLVGIHTVCQEDRNEIMFCCGGEQVVQNDRASSAFYVLLKKILGTRVSNTFCWSLSQST
jgi:hypothetical protein